MILEINNLSKKYGDKKALNKFSCKFTEGIYGLLGPNGAGKSTFMNILVDAIDRSSGEIWRKTNSKMGIWYGSI